MESEVYNARAIVTLLQQQSLMPDDFQTLIALTMLIAGVLANVYLGLYISEKRCKSLCGIRVMICNQVCANLLALFSHAFLPAHSGGLRKSETGLDYLCKIMPSLGFLGVTVSLSNLACTCVAYYYNKKVSVVLSRLGACLIVVNLWLIAIVLTAPMAISLDSLELTFNNTRAKMCAIVWQTRRYEEMYMDCVFVFKFLLPLLVIFTICLKVELLAVRSSKALQSFPKLPAFLLDILAVTCFLLLVYFYPLHEAAPEKTSHGVDVLDATKAFGIIRVLELVGLTNCCTIPVVLKACVDEYSVVSGICENHEKDYLAVSSDDESAFFLAMPSANVGMSRTMCSLRI